MRKDVREGVRCR